MKRFGGTFVLNWHDRSLAPERLWNQLYDRLLKHISEGSRVWFATAIDAVDWFRWRRTIQFALESDGSVTVRAERRDGMLPPAQVLVRRPGRTQPIECLPFDRTEALSVQL
jgi:hypothetical protein